MPEIRDFGVYQAWPVFIVKTDKINKKFGVD